MATATIGSRYQVVIPKKVRKAVNLRPTSQVVVEAHGDCILIYPEHAASLRGLGSAVADGSDINSYVAQLRAEWDDHQ